MKLSLNKEQAAMKRLLKSTIPPKTVTVSYADYIDNSQAKAEAESKDKNRLTFGDVVDIISQVEEFSKFNVAIRNDDGRVLLAVGDSVYEIGKVMDNRYPRRRLSKLET
jgi:branched-subunit amino acid aminotransferase/4-amino-4-deoxychorismate lyase